MRNTIGAYWGGVFPILNVLLPGIVLAFFAAYYQNRRKREIQIEGKLAIERIDGYEQILSCLYEGQDNHEMTLEEEKKAAAILWLWCIGRKMIGNGQYLVSGFLFS